MNGKFANALQSVACACLAAVGAMSVPGSAQAAAYVGNQASGTVSVIDTERDELTRTLPDHGKIGGKVQAVVTDRAEKTAFAVDADANALVAIDVATGRIMRSLDVGQAPEGASLSPSGKTIAVCVENDNKSCLVDVAINRGDPQEIPTQGKNPEHCVFSPRRKMADDEQRDFRRRRHHRSGQGSVGRIVHTIGTPARRRLASGRSDRLVAQENSQRRRRHRRDRPQRDSVDPHRAASGRRDHGTRWETVFVSNGGDGNISAIDAASRKVDRDDCGRQTALEHGAHARWQKAVRCKRPSGDVTVIDAAKLAVIKTIPVGKLPWGVDIP